jgi:hypothetical protein
MFVRFGLLSKNERVAFSDADLSTAKELDLQKGINHIPLIDLETRETWYGIDALLEILGRKCRWIKTIGQQKPVNWFLVKFYDLVSYNRKVIVAKKCGTGQFDCSPSFSGFHRWVFMCCFLVINSIMLNFIHDHVLENLSLYRRSQAELQLAHFSLIFINLLLAASIGGRKAIEYLGQVNMLALITVLMMIPLLVLSSFIRDYETVIFGYLGLVSLVVISEYFRRMDYAGIAGNHTPLIVINLLSLAGFIAYIFL